MANRTTEDIIGELYDLVQAARTMPLAMDKCILERDKVLDLLDEIIAQLPSELKQARMMLEHNDELVTAAKRKAEQILKDASERARKLVTEHEVYLEAKAQANEMHRASQQKIAEMRKAAIDFVDESLRVTEETIAQSLSDVRSTRQKFRNIKGSSNKPNTAIIEDV